MKKRIKKPLAVILSFSLLIGCFTGFPFVASATDGETTETADESNLFTFADFEDGSSPFTYNWDGKQYGNYYQSGGNTALLINGYDAWLKSYLPDGTVSGTVNQYGISTEAMPNNIQGFAHTIGNEGYRPQKVSFMYKPIGRDSNTSLIIYPLTFAGNSGKAVPFTEVLGMSMSFASAANVSNPYMNWSPSNYAGTFAPAKPGTETVFTDITDIVSGTTVNAGKLYYATRKFIKAEDSIENNLKLIEEEIQWYTMDITYNWNDTTSQVTICATYGDETTSYSYEYTVSYNENIIDAYNFGIIAGGTATAILIDDFAYYSENPTTQEVVGPHTAFITKHQTVISTANGFDVTDDYEGKTSEEKTALKDGIDAFLTEYATQKDVVKNYAAVQTAYANVTTMKNAILDYDAKAVLEDFKTEYADLLAIVNDDLTIAPEDLAKEGLADETATAVETFNAIDEDLRSSTEGEVIGNKLSRLTQCLGYQSIATGDGVYTQNFEGINDFEAYAEYEEYEETLIGTVSDFNKNGVISTDTNNNTAYGVQTVVPNNFSKNDTSDYGQFVTADKTLYDVMKNNGKYLSSGSFDMYLLPYYNATKEQMIVYGFKDVNNYRFFGMYGQKASSAPSTISVSMRDYEVTNLTGAASEVVGTQALQRRATGFHSTTDFANKWYHFDFMYDSEGKFHLVITDENGRLWSYDSERTVSVALEERILAFGVMGEKDQYYIDNVTLKFTENGTDEQIDERVAFYTKQSVRETTELVTEKIVPYDFARIERFIDDYNALSEANKSLMPLVGGCASRLQAQMNLWDATSDSKIAESFATIYGDKLEEQATLSVFNRLTVTQREFIKENYADKYNTMINAAKSSTTDATVDITCVGDSITYGSGATDATTDSYPAQLATKLGEGYNVYKHGVPGIKVLQSSSVTDTASTDGQFRGTEQNYIGYYSSVATNPDIVIIMLGTNDLVVDSKTRECSDEKRAQIKAGYTDLVQSYLALDCNPTVILATIPANNYPKSDTKNRYYTTRAKSEVLSEIYEEVAAEYGLALIDIGAFTWQWTDEEKTEYFATDNLHPSTAGYNKLSGFFADYITAGIRISNTASACMYDFSAMDFLTIQPQVTDSIALTYKAQIGAALVKSAPAIKPVITFEMNGRTSEPVEGTLVEGTTDIYTFTYPEIMAQNMADKITATLKVGAASKAYEYSVMDYCQKVLDMDTIEGYSDTQLSKLKTMIVELVTYGAAVQKYRNSSIADSALLTNKLTQEQLALGTQDGSLEELEGVISVKLTGDDTMTDYKWKSVGLVLKEKVNIRCRFIAEDIENLIVKIKVEDQDVASMSSADFTEADNDNEYYLDFDGIYAYEYGKTIQVSFWNGDTQIGKTLNYSVNTYLNTKKADSDTNLVALLKAINNYGNAAVDYYEVSAATTGE